MGLEKNMNTNEKTAVSRQLSELNEKKPSGVVDINLLLARVRVQKKADNKINMIFFALFAGIIFVAGILLSL